MDAWIADADLLQHEAIASEVADAAGNDDVLHGRLAAARMDEDMVVLEPHGVEGGVLPLDVVGLPGDLLRVELRQQLAHLCPDQRYAAEPAVVPGTCNEIALQVASGQPRLVALILWQDRWQVLGTVDLVLGDTDAERGGPDTNGGDVGGAQCVPCGVGVALQMGLHGLLQQGGRLKYLRDRWRDAIHQHGHVFPSL